jgi:hypothetical protein
LASTAALAQWNRYLGTAKGDWVDTPPARDLRCFRVDPCARSDKKDRFLECPVSGKPNQYSLVTNKLRTVGKTGEFTVYDLMYFNTNDQESQMQSVLVGIGNGQLHEIHVRVNNNGRLFPVEIVHAGNQPVVKASLDDGGMYHSVVEEYFLVSQRGASLLSFDPVSEAAAKALPGDLATYYPAHRLDFSTLVFWIGTEQLPLTMGPKVSCCVGHVEVPFRIEQGKVIAGEGKYFPTFP